MDAAVKAGHLTGAPQLKTPGLTLDGGANAGRGCAADVAETQLRTGLRRKHSPVSGGPKELEGQEKASKDATNWT